MDRTELKLIAWWVGLIGITLISWDTIFGGLVSQVRHIGAGINFAGTKFRPEDYIQSSAFPVAIVMVLAFVKVRIVVYEFMCVRHAPIQLRIFLDAWVLLTAIALMSIYADVNFVPKA